MELKKTKGRLKLRHLELDEMEDYFNFPQITEVSQS